MTLKSTFKLALLSLLLNSSGVLAADNSAVLGQWDLSLNLQGNEIPINLTITEDTDGLGGTWTSPRATNTLSDVSLVGDTLSFSMQTQQGSLKVSFELEGDTLNGGLSTPQGNLPIVGKKSS
jgi:hypothetical protein